MKKILLSAALVILVAGAGYLIYRYGPQNQQTSTSSVSSSQLSSQASSQAESSAVSAVSSAPKSAQTSSVVKTAPPAAAGQKQQSINSIKTAIRMDWKKYGVKASSQTKIIQNKTYQVFDIWAEDYQVGPKILVDPSNGKIYTWSSTDTAPVPASTDPAFDKTVRTITGTMEDGAMMSITLKTPDGSEISVPRYGIDTSGLTSMKIGDKIKVTYTGIIKGSDTSRAFITKMENVK